MWLLHDQAPLQKEAAIAMDTHRGVVVISGGYQLRRPWQGGPVDVDSTWERSTTGWSERAGNSHPPAGLCTAMAYDALRRRVVRFGGSPTQAFDSFP